MIHSSTKKMYKVKCWSEDMNNEMRIKITIILSKMIILLSRMTIIVSKMTILLSKTILLLSKLTIILSKMALLLSKMTIILPKMSIMLSKMPIPLSKMTILLSKMIKDTSPHDVTGLKHRLPRHSAILFHKFWWIWCLHYRLLSTRLNFSHAFLSTVLKLPCFLYIPFQRSCLLYTFLSI